MAGRKVIDRAKESKTPIATSVPRWLKGGTSEKFIVRNPIAVVVLARKTGCKFILRLFVIASFLP
jgi:hypothetical protein